MVTGPPVGPLDAGRATSGAVGGEGLSLIITVPKCLCKNIRLEKKKSLAAILLERVARNFSHFTFNWA